MKNLFGEEVDQLPGAHEGRRLRIKNDDPFTPPSKKKHLLMQSKCLTMEPLGNITLHLGDCLDVLKTLPDESFDLAIVDPPYYSGPERRQFYGSNVSTVGVARHSYPVAEKWRVPTAEYFDELMRVAKYYIVWGCNYFNYIFAHGRISGINAMGNHPFPTARSRRPT